MKCRRKWSVTNGKQLQSKSVEVTKWEGLYFSWKELEVQFLTRVALCFSSSLTVVTQHLLGCLGANYRTLMVLMRCIAMLVLLKSWGGGDFDFRCHLMFSAKMVGTVVGNVYSARPQYRPVDLDPQLQGLLFFVLFPLAFPPVWYLQAASQTPCWVSSSKYFLCNQKQPKSEKWKSSLGSNSSVCGECRNFSASLRGGHALPSPDTLTSR